VFSVARELKGLERGRYNSRPFQIDISGSVFEGRLKMNWIFNANKYSEKELQKFADTYIDELKKIIEETSSEFGGYTPSDFQDVNLDEQELDSIFSELNDEFEDE